MLDVIQIPVLNDNYIYLIHDPKSDQVAIVDPAVEDEVVAALSAHGWVPNYILNTHHHGDHVGANLALKERYGLQIVGPAADRDRIPGIDIALKEGETITIGDESATVFDVPGHTRGHIAYYFAESAILFCGDTLFAMGCGRLFEGTPAEMWQSLQKFMTLPRDTSVYCAHEYTEANGRFALSVEPGNIDLQDRMKSVSDLRAKGKPTVPFTIGAELDTNPFLRPASANLQATIGLEGADLVSVFAETRARKDSF